MAKALKTAALVVGVVAATVLTYGALTGAAAGAAAGGAAATGAAAGAGAAAAGAGAAAAAGSSILGLSMATWGAVAAVSSMVSAGLNALTMPGFSAEGNQTQYQPNPHAPVPYVIGRTYTAGSPAYRRDHTSPGDVPNDRLTDVVIFSGGGPVDAIEQLYMDKEPYSFNASGGAIGAYSGYFWAKSQLGATPEPAALSVSSGDGSPPPAWTAASKLSGYAAAIFTARFDSKGKLFPNGEPSYGAVLRGTKVYDPRLDSTYPGGSGPCRPLQENTYVYSENPYLHALTWLLGRYQNGKRMFGPGIPLSLIDVPAYVHGANVAQANNWKVGGVIYSTDGKWETLKRILQSGGGIPTTTGAVVSCLVNAPVVSLATITMDDLVGEAEVSATRGRTDRINSIVPRYRSAQHQWEIVSAEPIEVTAHIAEDAGEVRSIEYDIPFCQNVEQAAQLSRYYIENTREFGPITLTLKPRWLGYKPGDAVTLNLPPLGLNNQLAVITDREFSPDARTVRLTLRSETTAKHAFALGQTTNPPPLPSIAAPPLVPTPLAEEWDVTATELQDGSVTKPAIVLTGAATVADPDFIITEIREWPNSLPNDQGWVKTGTDNGDMTKKYIVSVLPDKMYQVAISYKQRGQTSDRLILGPVTTGEDSALSAAEAAMIAAENAQAIVDGKIATYVQPTPPTDPDLDFGDLWSNTSDGKLYSYVGYDLRIAGQKVTIGGTAIRMPWALFKDQFVDDALLGAAGAAAIADRKVMTFYSTSTPEAEGVGDLWINPTTKIVKRWDGQTWSTDFASIGAPPGTTVGDQPAEQVAAAAVNFDRRNDRNGDAIPNPTIPTDGTAVDHANNANGSIDMSLEWAWSGNNADIDGFAVYVYASTSGGAYTIGTNPAAEQMFFCSAEKRAFILYGCDAKKYYTFGVRAYRVVDPDVNTSGIIQTPIIQPTGTGENPYYPPSQSAAAGDITTTISGVAASVIVGRTQNLTDGGMLNPLIGIDTGVLRTLGNDIAIVRLRDGDTFLFPSDWGQNTPAVVGMVNTMIGASEFIECQAINVTSAGFTARCKRVVAVSGVATQIVAAATPSPPRVAEKVKPNDDIAAADRFTFSFNVRVANQFLAEGEYIPGRVTLGFWTFDGVTWQQNTTASYGGYATTSQTFHNGQTVSVARPNMSNGSRFGISVVSTLYGGGLDAFNSVSYNAVGSVSETTATPTGFPGMDFLIVGGGKVE